MTTHNLKALAAKCVEHVRANGEDAPNPDIEFHLRRLTTAEADNLDWYFRGVAYERDRQISFAAQRDAVVAQLGDEPARPPSFSEAIGYRVEPEHVGTAPSIPPTKGESLTEEGGGCFTATAVVIALYVASLIFVFWCGRLAQSAIDRAPQIIQEASR